jgi:hypothetical protein
MGTQTRYILLSLDRLYVVAVLNKPVVLKIASDLIYLAGIVVNVINFMTYFDQFLQLPTQ